MNLIEAVKTGKRFRRPQDAEVYGADWYCGGAEMALGPEDILATDWEIEPETKEVDVDEKITDADTKIQKAMALLNEVRWTLSSLEEDECATSL